MSIDTFSFGLMRLVLRSWYYFRLNSEKNRNKESFSILFCRKIMNNISILNYNVFTKNSTMPIYRPYKCTTIYI